MTAQEKYKQRQAKERQKNIEQRKAQRRTPTANILKKHKDIKILLELSDAQTVKSGRETIAKTKERIRKLEANGRITGNEAETLQEIAQEQLIRIGTREHQEKSGLRKPRTEEPSPPSYKQKPKKGSGTSEN